jgi:hypothetical protein
MINNSIFLLGGIDLEMLEIKNILTKENLTFYDKKLTWGAKLSDYKDILKKYENINNTKIYAIELEIDMLKPDNCIEIDHHNKNSNNPSSLEQICTLLNIDISKNRYLQLVSANDKNYIFGMKQINASEKEIFDIRNKDREAQGITKEDEYLAQISIDKSSSNIIYSLTTKFTCINDRIFGKYNNYIIYNDFQIIFYGYEISKIKIFFEMQNIEEKQYYYGGGDLGFIGIKNNILRKEEIEFLIKEFTVGKK